MKTEKNKNLVQEKQQKEIEEQKLHVQKAKICSDSLINAALTVHSVNNNKADIETLCKNFSFQVDKIISGDVRRIETMFATQAQTLDALFHTMLQRASNTNSMAQSQFCTEVALKAQKQCRQTLSALIETKHPSPATFIRQQNNAINQQVNNSLETKNLEKQNIANELKEVTNEPVDTRTTITPVTVNSPVETMEISGSKNTRR